MKKSKVNEVSEKSQIDPVLKLLLLLVHTYKASQVTSNSEPGMKGQGLTYPYSFSLFVTLKPEIYICTVQEKYSWTNENKCS